ncbi:hypothetical protein TRSC58_06594 [Trypanosoma rangeli SC58]|uniref:Trans-sialidase C-terminal domain-containing protein n=1 Tax=Trypanosoma rangeli SC58 TaxID=429131 RepID=A0A061IUJ9_TRYRA|nr:hypothetical protein TRSC58_06594 [Trypanosoma rangeli SC58]
MDWDDWFVYVGGDKIYSMKYDGALFRSSRISHFFFGVDDKSKDEANSPDVTVTDVLLYSRVLSGTELTNIKGGKVTLPPPDAGEEIEEQQELPASTDNERPASGTQPPSSVANGADSTEVGTAAGAPTGGASVPAVQLPQPGADTGSKLNESGDSAVRGCMPRVVLLALLGLCGVAAVF